MKLDKLQYQLDAIENIVTQIDDNKIEHDNNFNANPIWHNAKNIDVKMETGTGKTYVYTRLMHELKLRFAFFKFIIIVPSLAIKEGVKMSVRSDDWNKHFRQEFNNQNISLGVINAGDFETKKGKRKQIPEPLRSFCDATKNETNTIQCLLLNDAMLASSSMTRNDYDSTLLGSISCPVEGLKNTRPIVIVDEPHRFNKENKAWKNIVEGLSPQMIIRFGATFPEKTEGKGKLKQTKKDYENLVYDLNSVRAFNDGLVKGVHIVYPALANKNSPVYKVTSINKGKSIRIGNDKLNMELKVDDQLSIIDSEFGGNLTLEFDKDYPTQLKLSNELAVDTGLSICPEIYSNSYQELLIQQALEAHFEREKANFCRQNTKQNLPKIKTNSLFFIDRIESFRGENAWLRRKFEQLLTDKLQKEIENAKGEFKKFLQASLNNVSACLAGYFAEDNKSKEYQNEVDKVLRDKEQSLQFKNKNDQWNTCRFFFSKWTLCEGWDNPNVFVICKLRSSGSEIRKLQEVGRGLRLPFDENGNRINNEEFYLRYIVDFSERDFAKKLVGEINSDNNLSDENKMTEKILELLVNANYAPNNAKVKAKLLNEEIIDEYDTILDIEKLLEQLPEGNGLKINKGKIIGEGLPERPKIRLIKENFEKLRELWNQITKRYLLHFEKLDENELNHVLQSLLESENIFVQPAVQIVEESLRIGKNHVEIESNGYKSVESSLGIIPYGEFLKQLNKQTQLPVKILHKNIIVARNNAARKGEPTPPELFNTNTVENIVRNFERKFIEIFAQSFTYQELNYTARTSLFTEDGSFVTELPQGDVGEKTATDIPPEIQKKIEKYLYDKFVYDSEIEHEVLKVDPPDRVIVYGKLPRRSIKLPTYTGGTTSPDFVFAIKKNNSNDIELHLIVETKSDNPRLSDIIAIESQKKVFDSISTNIKWRMETNIATFEKELKKLAGK
ncbi:MAG: type III restriction-modification system endonuclease [Planctomycetaceae bacterium]|jgi:type III restriction enzyme|nr:type III restriction-modification system endonuclease [Planctomycetaceae bacterium]